MYNQDPQNIAQGSESASAVLNAMEQKKEKFCVVVDQDKPVGYVTKKMIKYEKGPVKELAEKFPIHLRKRTPARDALSYMLMHSFQTLCVVGDNHRFIGTVTYDDIQDTIRQSYAVEEE